MRNLIVISHVVCLVLAACTSTVGSGSDNAGADAASANDAATLECGNDVCDSAESCDTCALDCPCASTPAANFVRMQTGYAGGQQSAGIVPGGMAAAHTWFASQPLGYNQIVFGVAVEDEPVATSSYFWAEQFWFVNGDGGYTGLQTGGSLGGQNVGKMFIFSVWDTLGATPGPDSSCETFSGEGVGYSCRMQHDWIEGRRYLFEITRLTTSSVQARVIDELGKKEWLLGTIELPAGWGKLSNSTASFAEYFWTTESCNTLPLAVARFDQASADGTAPTTITSETYGTCASAAVATCTGPLCQ